MFIITKQIQNITAAAFVAVFITACTGTDEIEEREIIGSVETLYNSGMNAMESGAYIEAIQTLQELERQHPYSGWATRAQMMITYAQYRRGEYDEAVAGVGRFLRMHPGHKDIPYMIYIKGLSYYERISDVKRDQGHTLEALKTFKELTSRFPDNEYSKDARLKITLCLDHLAGQEMMVGRYYQKEGRFLAAINRFRYVVEVYETSGQTAEALYRLTESYLSLGIDDEAQAAAAVLGHNFPGSDWYADAYALMKGQNLEPVAKEGSWLGNVFKGVKESLSD